MALSLPIIDVAFYEISKIDIQCFIQIGIGKVNVFQYYGWNWINNSTVNFIKAVYKHLTISLISQVNVEF